MRTFGVMKSLTPQKLFVSIRYIHCNGREGNPENQSIAFLHPLAYISTFTPEYRGVASGGWRVSYTILW